MLMRTTGPSTAAVEPPASAVEARRGWRRFIVRCRRRVPITGIMCDGLNVVLPTWLYSAMVEVVLSKRLPCGSHVASLGHWQC